ncbi:DUF218-domain-containing protein [Cryphonectria parasitica EP155]|uniref:DUF218-domain-containing protein n=1 Tax=Cryphonectria parasitica (strain ATCC 38755 / EP155) TaxID=660469 RepID=A0A9P4XZ00_CRYP1|nr:DUF218-domain-containing protein [Cryphonectria parasitica EP155]KAF3763125.1 DUF218-domain-containing protein [Cryphonectria parasitica EP155]
MTAQPPLQQPSQVMHDASLIYNYHRTRMPLPTTGADAIFCLCSLDLRVAKRAAQLFLDGLGRWLIFSGGSGTLTAGRPQFRDNPEAVVFASIAKGMGVPEDKMIVEPRSTNTGENVRFTYEMLRARGLLQGRDESAETGIRSFILVQKPYMERRTFATFMRQWPGMTTTDDDDNKDAEKRRRSVFTVTSPQLDFAEYPDENNPRDLVINIMVGDLIRIRDYPAKGYQIEQDIPDDVWEAGQRLLAAGFNKHLP